MSREPFESLDGPQESRDSRIDELVAGYLDRLNSGESVDPLGIISEHPEEGPEIIERLEAFVGLGLGGSASERLATLGDYTLKRRIGRGGMGVVYEAWQGSVDRPVALKVLPAGIAADTRAVTRFVREAQAAGKLHHPNVVSVYGMGVEAGTPYYAMELVEGETLARVLDRLREAGREGLEAERARVVSTISPLYDTGGVRAGGTTVPSARRQAHESPGAPGGRPSELGSREPDLSWFAKVAAAFAGAAEGLQHAHEHGVIHRDLKPSNLILDRDGRLRILDFGLARLEGQQSLTATGDFLGTPSYMSPEQAMAKRIPVDRRTDVYSLGATLYETLCLEPPFRGRDAAETLSHIIARDPVPPRRVEPRVPRDLETIALKCLRKDPAARYGTAEALAQDLRRFARGDPIEARPQGRWERLRTRAWRRRRALAALGLAAVAAVALGALALDRQRVERERTERSYIERIEEAVRTREIGRLTLRLERAPAQTPKATGPFALLYHVDDFEAALDAGLVETSVELLGEAATLLPARPEAYYHRAVAREILGRKEEALADLRECLRRAPGFVAARALRDALEGRAPRRAPGTAGEPGTSPVAGPAGTGASGATDAAFEAWRRVAAARLAGDRGEEAEAYDAAISTLSGGRTGSAGLAVECLLASGAARLASGDALGAALRLAVAADRWPRALEPTLLLAQALLILKEDGRTEAALRSFHAAASEDASGARGGISLADRTALGAAGLYRAFGKLERALEWAERLSPGARRERTRADLLCHLRRFDEARRAGIAAVTCDPGDPESYVYLEWASESSPEEPTDAGRLCREIVARDPRNAGALTVLAVLAARRRAFEEAFDLFQRALACDPGNISSRTWYAGALRQGGNLVKARTVLEEARSLPARTLNERRGVAFNLGALHELSGNLDTCLELYREALLLDPGQAWNHALVGHVLVRLGRVSEAIPHLDDARALGASDVFTIWEIGRARRSMGDLEGAVREYRECVRVAPKDWYSWWYLGGALSLLGVHREAADALGEAVRLWPNNPGPRRDLADALVRAGRTRSAFHAALDCIAGLRTGPWSVRMLDRLGGIQSEGLEGPRPDGEVPISAADWDEVVGTLEPVRAARADDVVLLHALALGYLRGETRRDLAKAREAIEAADEAQENRDPWILATLAEVRFEEGRKADAVVALEEALALRPRDPVLLARHASYSKALLPEVISFRSIDAVLAGRDPARDAELLEPVVGWATATNAGAGSEPLRSYLEARVLERAGSFAEAAAKLRALREAGERSPAATLRLADCLRLSDEAREAERILRGSVASEGKDDVDLWNLWARVSLDDLGRTPAEAAAAFPVDPDTGRHRSSGYAADVLWLLRTLSSEGEVRIDCGRTQDGAAVGHGQGSPWGADRFFLGGETATPTPAWVLWKKLPPYLGTERFFAWGEGVPGYRVPLPRGTYAVTIHAIELWYGAAGLRRFDVRLEGREVAPDLDYFAQLGFGVPWRETFEVPVDDGALDLELVPKVENPSISGLEIRPLRR